MKSRLKLKYSYKAALPILAVFFFAGINPAAGKTYERRTPVVEAVNKVLPSVVNISTSKTVRELIRVNPFGSPFRTPFDQVYEKNYDVKGLGSGVLVKGKYVVTNYHVLQTEFGNADEILVTFYQDNSQYPAQVVGYNPNADVAILKLEEQAQNDISRPGLEWGRSDDLMIGETTIAIGNALGQPFTVTSGIISALNRTITASDNLTLTNLIQTNADINRGNSGGPLVNINGEFIGLNTAIISPSGGSIGLGFAIPVARVRRIYDYWVNDILPLEDQLNISTQTLNAPFQDYFLSEYPNLTKDQLKGAVVVEDPQSRLAKGILYKRDIITSVDGKAIFDSDDFINRLDEHRGATLKMTIIREGRPRQVTINTPTENVQTTQWAGMEVQELDNPWRRRFGLRRNVEQLVIREVQPKSSADEAGLQSGDLIETINGQAVSRLQDFRNVFRNSVNARTIQVQYLRYTNGEWKRNRTRLEVVPAL